MFSLSLSQSCNFLRSQNQNKKKSCRRWCWYWYKFCGVNNRLTVYWFSLTSSCLHEIKSSDTIHLFFYNFFEISQSIMQFPPLTKSKHREELLPLMLISISVLWRKQSLDGILIFVDFIWLFARKKILWHETFILYFLWDRWARFHLEVGRRLNPV